MLSPRPTTLALTTALLATAFLLPALGEEPSASVRTAILVADAEKLYRDGKYQEAVTLYDKASARAFSEGAVGTAFELSRTAAAVLQAQGQFGEAGDRLRRLALANADHPEAADSHRAGIVCLAEAMKNTPSRATDYADAMSEFLQQWPQHPACDEVRWWLAKWRLASGSPRQAIKLLLAVPVDNSNHEQAMRLLGDAGLATLAQLSQQGADAKERGAFVTDFTHDLQPVVTGEANRWPTQWSDAQRAAAVSLARVHLACGQANAAYAHRILTAAAAGRPAADQGWLAEAAPVLVRTALATRDLSGALGWVGRLSPASAPRCEHLVGELETEAIDGAEPASAGALLLTITER
ncbi:MAG: hypothetical protein KDA37_10315, partial [Planctomycetales bacterium]|nr:hypothetical protein [Planctomycetales bacterium]